MCVLLVMLELLVLLLVLRLLVEVGVERRLRLGLAPRRGRCGGLRLMGHAIPFSPSLRKYTCTPDCAAVLRCVWSFRDHF